MPSLPRKREIYKMCMPACVQAGSGIYILHIAELQRRWVLEDKLEIISFISHYNCLGFYREIWKIILIFLCKHML